jgi:hypothetical protein
MLKTVTMDIEQAKLDPATVFRKPADVLKADGISREDKKAILLRWEQDAEALIRATEEGMPPADNRGPGELLRDVQAALQTLDPHR